VKINATDTGWRFRIQSYPIHGADGLSLSCTAHCTAEWFLFCVRCSRQIIEDWSSSVGEQIHEEPQCSVRKDATFFRAPHKMLSTMAVAIRWSETGERGDEPSPSNVTWSCYPSSSSILFSISSLFDLFFGPSGCNENMHCYLPLLLRQLRIENLYTTQALLYQMKKKTQLAFWSIIVVALIRTARHPSPWMCSRSSRKRWSTRTITCKINCKTSTGNQYWHDQQVWSQVVRYTVPTA